jgi:hypothetical protein
MRCSEGLDTFGKWRSRTDTQPVAFPDEKALGCHTSGIDESEGHKLNVFQCESQENSDLNTSCIDESEGHKLNIFQCESQENSDLNTSSIDENECRKFIINQCESHGKSDLDTISLYIDSRDSRKLKFLIDTGAKISIIGSSSLTPGVEYQWHKEMNIKGISKTVMKTVGKVDLRLFTDTHETTHTFHVLGGNFEKHYDAILGKDFLEERESVINYCSRQIVMNNKVAVSFDPKLGTIKKEPCRLTLKARSEHIVNVPTHSEGLGLLSRDEISPGVYLASSLTRLVNGVCATSILNTNETDLTIQLPRVTLESLYTSEGVLTLTATAVSSEDSRLSGLYHHLRLDHLDREERASILTICEEYNDLFHLPGDKLTCTSTIEHAIPTPTVDPHRAINVNF